MSSVKSRLLRFTVACAKPIGGFVPGKYGSDAPRRPRRSGASILITSAPRSASMHAHIGPAQLVVTSITRTPCSGPVRSRRAPRDRTPIFPLRSPAFRDCGEILLREARLRKRGWRLVTRSVSLITMAEHQFWVGSPRRDRASAGECSCSSGRRDVYQPGSWDLPGGHLAIGESHSRSASRARSTRKPRLMSRSIACSDCTA